MNAGSSLVHEDRLGLLVALLAKSLKLKGEVWECGVYAGGSALRMAESMRRLGYYRTLRLFDSFTGIKSSGPMDSHRNEDYADVDLDSVRALFLPFKNVVIYKGVIPEVFDKSLNSKICFAHVDVDVYASTKGCLEFIWPNVSNGGIIVVDDYFAPQCAGCKMAVDEFLEANRNASMSAGLFPQCILDKV